MSICNVFKSAYQIRGMMRGLFLQIILIWDLLVSYDRWIIFTQPSFLDSRPSTPWLWQQAHFGHKLDLREKLKSCQVLCLLVLCCSKRLLQQQTSLSPFFPTKPLLADCSLLSTIVLLHNFFILQRYDINHTTNSSFQLAALRACLALSFALFGHRNWIVRLASG